ncbi:MAG: NAD-binding protein [Sulfolobales archaeon]
MRYIVVGSSNYVSFILSAIKEVDPRGIIFFIDRSQEISKMIASQFNINYSYGDLLDPSVYQRINADIADVAIAATDSDALNIRLIELFKKVFSVPRVAAVINNPMNINEYLRAGVDLIINPTATIESMMKAFISNDRWIRSSTPELFGLDVYLNRFVKETALGVTLSYIRDAIKDLGDVLVFVVSREGKIIRDPLYELVEGDSVVIVSPKGLGEEAVKRVTRSIERLKILRTGVDTGITRI